MIRSLSSFIYVVSSLIVRGNRNQMSMLSGIQVGKRKRKDNQDQYQVPHIKVNTDEVKDFADDKNKEAASKLRAMLTSKPRNDTSTLDDIKKSAEPMNDKAIYITAHKPETLQMEDLRHGSRKGKLKQHGSVFHSGSSTTIQQMIQEETSEKLGGTNMDDTFAENVYRLKSRYKGDDFIQRGPGRSSGADEDDIYGDGGVDLSMFQKQSSKLTDLANYNREKTRQIATALKEDACMQKCWWWLQSSSFHKNMLISLGNYVSLVLSPSHLSLVEMQSILVPIQQTESYILCEDEVWDEVKRFKTSLRNMFRELGKALLFCETVFESRSLWQTRLDVIPVPLDVAADAPIFFKSAMLEQIEDWGTHTKIFSTHEKGGLRYTIPKGFPYFYVEWDAGGYAMIIETSSFSSRFAVDTIASMLDVDPLRMQNKCKSSEEDRLAISNFLSSWKKHDWTDQLK